MKLFLISILSVIVMVLQTPLENVREQFPEIDTLVQADAFINQLKDDVSPEAKGYTAAMVFMKSRYVKNPFTKLKYFKQGKEILDGDINENPENIEIRYIRYVMQKKIPDFLGYNEFISEDFNVIMNNILESNLSTDFKTEILTNMLLVENLSSEEKEKINQIKTQL